MREAAELDTERPSIKHWNDRIDESDNTAVRLFYPVYRGDSDAGAQSTDLVG